jgi:two-component system response regulator AtoC
MATLDRVLGSAVGWLGARLLHRRARILVIGDFEPYVELLLDTLRKGGYRADPVHPSFALRAVETRQYHVVVSGLSMPWLSGFDLLAAVRATSPQTQVILLSGDATGKRAGEALQRGALAVLDKRAMENLRRWVTQALEHALTPPAVPRSPVPVPVRIH